MGGRNGHVFVGGVMGVGTEQVRHPESQMLYTHILTPTVDQTARVPHCAHRVYNPTPFRLYLLKRASDCPLRSSLTYGSYEVHS